ncbi:MAG: AsnC family transcriptional regulator [Alphaproteobacteria bacterium]|nr:AsnC family transcriptional regulator [Alphaproteobacteria bacterium]
MDVRDQELINALHGGFPIEDRPYAAIGRQLGMSEEEVIERLQRLLADRTLTRFGPLYDAAKLGGAFTLAAMSVPAERFDEVAEIVNSFPEVAHNYAREHALNMWFVVGAEKSERINVVLSQIKDRTGIEVLNMPKEEEYFLELRLTA